MRTFFLFGSVLQSEIPINQRIAILIESFAEGKQRRFAEAVGVSPSAISDLFGKRQNTPSTEMLQKIAAAYPQVMMDWLIAGFGRMTRPSYLEAGDPKEEVNAGYQILIDLTTGRDRMYHLRQIWGISAAVAANACGITEEELLDIEAGRANASFQNLIDLGDLYHTRPEYLEGGNDIGMHFFKLLANEVEHLRAKAGESQAVPMVTVDSNQKANISLVSTQAAASYPTRYLEPEYYKELPAFSIPLPQLRNATFRAFQVSGASMVPTFYPGGWVIARYQDHQAESIQQDWPYVVVTKEAVLVKRIVDRTQERSALALQSDNEDYQTYDMPVGEVLELWRVVADLGFEFPNTRSDLARKVAELDADVSFLKQQIGQGGTESPFLVKRKQKTSN